MQIVSQAILFPLLLPLGVAPPGERPPLATAGLVGICALLYLAAVFFPEALLAALALQPAGNPHQFLTYAFLHRNLPHLVLNLYFLWVFGRAVEDRIGGVRMILFFLLATISGGIAHETFGTQPQLVGASAGVFGLLGVLAVLAPHARVRTWLCLLVLVVPVTMRTVTVAAWVFVVVYAAIEVALRYVLIHLANVPAAELASTAAHFGGLIAGAAATLAFYGVKGFKDRRSEWEELERWKWRSSSLEVPGQNDSEGAGEIPVNDPLMPIVRLVIQRRTEEARTAYLEALEKNPDACLPAGSQMNFVRQLITAGEYDLAIQALETLLKQHPSEEVAAVARYELAHLFLRLGRYPDRAAELLEKFLAANPPEKLEKQARALLGQLPAPRPLEQRRSSVLGMNDPDTEQPQVESPPGQVPAPEPPKREPSVLDVLDDILAISEVRPLQAEDIEESYLKLSPSDVARKADEIFGDKDSTGANEPIERLMANAPAPRVKAIKPLDPDSLIQFESTGGLSSEKQAGEAIELDLGAAENSEELIKIDDSGWVRAHGMQAPEARGVEAHPSMLFPLAEPQRPDTTEEESAVSDALWLPRKKAEQDQPSLKRVDADQETPKIILKVAKSLPVDEHQDSGDAEDRMRKFRSEPEPADQATPAGETIESDAIPDIGEQPKLTGPAFFIGPAGAPLAPDQTTPAAFQSALEIEPASAARVSTGGGARIELTKPARHFAVVFSPGLKVDMPAAIFLMSRELGLPTDPTHHALLRRRGILAEGLTIEAARALAEKLVNQNLGVTIAPEDPLRQFGEAIDIDRFVDLREKLRVGSTHGTEEIPWDSVVFVAGGWVGLAPGTPCRAAVDLYFRHPNRHLRIWESTFAYPPTWKGDRSRKFQSLVQLLMARTERAVHTRTLNTWLTGDDREEPTTTFTSLIEYENFLRWHLLVLCVEGEQLGGVRNDGRHE